jgi:lactobin A/cerein 7B family class IIb bacteriocin
MSMKAIRKAQQITVDEIATIAATGVTRALDARQAAGVELSSEELAQVNGGLSSITIAVLGYVPGIPGAIRVGDVGSMIFSIP